MRLVTLHNPAIIGAGGAVAAARGQVFDTFLRNSASIDTETPDYMNTAGGSWSVDNGAVDAQHDDSGVAICASTATSGVVGIDTGATGKKTVRAKWRCGTGGNTITVGVLPVYVLNTSGYWGSWWSRSAGTAHIYYYDGVSIVSKASTPHGGTGGVIQDVVADFDGTTFNTTWTRSGETSTFSYTVSGENTYSTETKVGFITRDAHSTAYGSGTYLYYFNGYETNGTEDTTLVVDKFDRSGDLDGDSPDISNGIGNTWATLNGGGTPTTGLITCSGTLEGGYAYCNSTSTTCIATYDMGQASSEITANFVMPSVSGSRRINVYPRFIDGSNSWIVECNGDSNELNIYYRKTGTSTLKATLGFTSSNRDLTCTETKLDGGVITSTWAADGGTPATVSYTISGEDEFTSNTKVGFGLRDSVTTGAVSCTAFKADHL